MTDRQLRNAAARFGTPLYVYDLSELRRRAEDLRTALPGSAGLYYSLKANPHPSVVAELRRAGCRAEVSSTGELDTALAAGHSPEEILCTGPGKTSAELMEVLERGVALISCESSAELRRLGRAVAATGYQAEVLLRLQPYADTKAGLSMTCGRQFGFSPDDAVRACADAPRELAFSGCHVYLGSQFPDADALLDGFSTAKETVERVCRSAGLSPRIVDLGGGFPWPYAAVGAGPELSGLSEGLEKLLSTWTSGPTPQVSFESGRRLVASAGRLLTTVLDVKKRPGGTVVVLDAGINVLGGMSGLGRVLRPSTGFVNLSAEEDRKSVTVDVVGPLCTPLDRLAARTTLQEPREGDLLCVPNVGAYGLSASLTGFLSRTVAAEAVYDGKQFIGASRAVTTAVPLA